MNKQVADCILLAVEHKQCPQYLYRYRSITQTIQFLKNPQFYLNEYTAFNDPFECAVSLDTDFSQEDFDRWLSDTGYSVPTIDISRNKEMIDGIIASAREEVTRKIGICCFTESSNNLLMWSHYADNHKGVCLKYDITIDPSAFLTLHRVVYNDDYPSLNYIKQQKEVSNALYHKSKAWEYEQEWRIIAPNKANTLRAVKPLALREIIFGCRCSPKDIDQVKQECLGSKGFHSVIFKQCRLKEDSFGLDIVELN